MIRRLWNAWVTAWRIHREVERQGAHLTPVQRRQMKREVASRIARRTGAGQ